MAWHGVPFRGVTCRSWVAMPWLGGMQWLSVCLSRGRLCRGLCWYGLVYCAVLLLGVSACVVALLVLACCVQLRLCNSVAGLGVPCRSVVCYATPGQQYHGLTYSGLACAYRGVLCRGLWWYTVPCCAVLCSTIDWHCLCWCDVLCSDLSVPFYGFVVLWHGVLWLGLACLSNI